MQMNGGYFGSMMPQSATSFMPPGASPSAMIGGIDGTPQGMTSPPMSQQLLAALASLAKMGQPPGGAPGAQPGPGGTPPNSGALPPNSSSPFMANGGQPPGGAPGAPPMGMGQLDPNMIKAMLAKMGIGGGGTP